MVKVFALLNETRLEFLNGHSKFNGGAVYVDLYLINDTVVSHQLSDDYYNLFKA